MKEWWIKLGTHDWMTHEENLMGSKPTRFSDETFYSYISSVPMENGIHVVDKESYDKVVAERDALKNEIPAIREALADFQEETDKTLRVALDVVKKERDHMRAEAEALAQALDEALRWDDFSTWSEAEAVLDRFRTKFPRNG